MSGVARWYGMAGCPHRITWNNEIQTRRNIPVTLNAERQPAALPYAIFNNEIQRRRNILVTIEVLYF